MKTKNYLIFFLLLNVSFGYAQCVVDAGPDMIITCGDSVQLQGDRNWSYTIDQFNSSNARPEDVFFTNELVGYMVGANGSIEKTIDGGFHWQTQISGTTSILRSVYFVNTDTGFVCGANGTLLRTIDAGANWLPQTSGTTEELNSVFFTSANTGFAAGTYGTLLKTINGGTSWVKKVTGTTSAISSVQFPDANTGYMGSASTIYRTTDGGETWAVSPTFVGVNFLNRVYFTSPSTGYATGSGTNSAAIICKTTDGGNTWTLKELNWGYATNAIFFTDVNTGYASSVSRIFKTTDAGLTWTEQAVSLMAPSSIYFPSAKVGYSVGYSSSAGNKVIKYTVPDIVTWSPATGLSSSTISNPIASPIVTTTYKLTTTTGTCTTTDSLKIVVSTLTVNGGGNKTLICGGSVQLNASSNYSGKGKLQYTWSPSTGLNSTTIANPKVEIKQTTTYTVTITTPNGCTATDTVKVNVDPFSVDAGSDQYITCGAKVKFDKPLTNYTGNGNLTYLWSPANNLDTATIPAPTSNATKETVYHVTVTTPNGCIATDSVKLLVNPLTVDAGVDQTIVCGSKAKFYSPLTNYTGNETLTYSWLPSASLDNATIPQPVTTANKTTVYHLTLTTPNGCVATDSLTIFVTPFIANSSGPVSLICGGSKQFNDVVTNYTGTDALTYSWLPSTGLNDPAIVKPTVTITTTGSYTLTVATSNGCQAKDTVIVNVDPLLANAGADKMNMCGDSVLLDNVTSNYTGTAPLTYSWLPATGLHNATVSNPLTGAHDLTYTVTVTTSNGCQASDQVRVDLKPMDAPEICMVGVDSTNKNVIRWNDLLWDAIDSVIIYRETTVAGNYVKIGSTAFLKNGFRDLTSQPEVKSNKYKISLLDTCGLESSKSVQHKTMHLAITKGVGTSWNLIWEPYEGFAVPTYNIYRGTDVNNLQFIDATSGTSTQFTNYNPPPGDLYYQVEVVNPNPCDPSNVAKALRSNVAASKYVGIFEQHENTFKFNLYPNPAADLVTLNVENASAKNTLIIIYNSIGAVVKSVPLQQNMQQIDVSDLSNGFYMVELKSVNGHAVQKLTIEK